MKQLLRALFCIFIIGLSSCSEPSLVGEEILPTSGLNGAQYSDTTSIFTFAIPEDSITTDNLSFYNLGSIENETFGKVVSDIFTQIRLPSNEIDLGDDLIFDSIVLKLDYNFFYGDSSAMQTIVVHELTEDMVESEDYNQTTTFNFGAELGRKDNHVHGFSDSLLINGNQIKPHLRIRLDDTYGQRFIDASSTNDFLNNDNFLSVFKGLYIQFDDQNSENKLMVAYDMASTLSTISLYYQNSESDSLLLNFPINANAETVNHITQNYTSSLIENYLNIDNAEGDSVCFALGQGGVNTRIEFPYLENYGEAVVNQATLTVYEIQRTGADTIYTAPEIMFLARQSTTVDEDGFGLISNADLTFEVDALGNIVYKYEFNVVILIQDLMEGEGLDQEIFLVPASRQTQPRRVVLGGNGHPTYPMRLEFTYTPL